MQQPNQCWHQGHLYCTAHLAHDQVGAHHQKAQQRQQVQQLHRRLQPIGNIAHCCTCQYPVQAQQLVLRCAGALCVRMKRRLRLSEPLLLPPQAPSMERG